MTQPCLLWPLLSLDATFQWFGVFALESLRHARQTSTDWADPSALLLSTTDLREQNSYTEHTDSLSLHTHATLSHTALKKICFFFPRSRWMSLTFCLMHLNIWNCDLQIDNLLHNGTNTNYITLYYFSDGNLVNGSLKNSSNERTLILILLPILPQKIN